MSDTAKPMDVRRIAKTFGILFLLTWVTAIAGRVLLDPVYSDARYILGDGVGAGVYLGAVFEFGVIATNIATAIVLYPLARRFSPLGVRVIDRAGNVDPTPVIYLLDGSDLQPPAVHGVRVPPGQPPTYCAVRRCSVARHHQG
jgi:hypothetical protein